MLHPPVRTTGRSRTRRAVVTGGARAIHSAAPRLWAAVLVVLGVVASAGAAEAQPAQGFAVDRMEPSEAGSDWHVHDALDFRGKLRPALRVLGDYQYRSLVAYRADDSILASVVRNQLALHASGAVVLFERLRLGASLPLVAYTDGRAARVGDTFYPSPAHEQSMGDLRVALDARVFGAYRGPLSIAVGARAWAPTGRTGDYTSDGRMRVSPHLAVAGDLGPVAYAARAGFLYRDRSEAYASGQIGSEITYGASLGVRAVSGHVLIGPEIFGSSVVDGGAGLGDKRSTPLEGVLTVRALVGSLRFGGGAGGGVTRGFGAPDVRLLASVELVPEIAERRDRDGDGLYDDEDACPTEAGPRTGDPRTSGCPRRAPPPPAVDSDGDGVIDTEDACPDVPGPRSADRRATGCPLDRDRDGVIDAEDACPDEPGQATRDRSTNGCADRDGDGVFDRDDACKDAPGVPASDPAKNGCPADADRDGDGVLDSVDACPDTPGEPSADPAKNGCPKAQIKDGRIDILEPVRFKTDSAVIEPGKDSEDVLTAILEILKAHPEITRVRVEGHTDDVGGAAHNKVLSAGRAAAVVTWLVGHGIDKARLRSVGFGSSRPVAKNDSDEGRRQNRRVELHIEAGGGAPAPPAPKNPPAPKKK